MADHWYELDITVTDVQGQKSVSHHEYMTPLPSVEQVPAEVVKHLRAQIGASRVKDAGSDD